jgi:hypothetical protein
MAETAEPASENAQSRLPEEMEKIAALCAALDNQNQEAALALVLAGADPNARQSPTADQGSSTPSSQGDELRPIDMAAIRGLSKFIRAVAARCDLNAKSGWKGRTPLMFAATHGHMQSFEALMAAGSDPGVLDNDGWPALCLALQHGHKEIAMRLIEDPRSELSRTFGAAHALSVYVDGQELPNHDDGRPNLPKIYPVQKAIEHGQDEAAREIAKRMDAQALRVVFEKALIFKDWRLAARLGEHAPADLAIKLAEKMPELYRVGAPGLIAVAEAALLRDAVEKEASSRPAASTASPGGERGAESREGQDEPQKAPQRRL